jgi:hypothetical protein
VTINYRLSTYGFLAVPGHLPGNYGLADQITALDWVIANIASFGGSPEGITIAGQSAGAGSVRVMLGSPKAIGKFQGAVGMSNLGLDFALGLGSGYGTTYSSVREPPGKIQTPFCAVPEQSSLLGAVSDRLHLSEYL